VHIATRFILITMALATISGCHHSDSEKQPKSFNPVLSFSQNPTEFWSVGFSNNATLDLDQFKLCKSSDTSDVIGMWHPGPDAAGYYPYVGQNRGKVSKAERTNGWAVRPGEIALEGSNSGQYSLLRFTVPENGSYRIKAVFEGVHFGLSTTDVHVLLNATSLFDDIVEGYGGDPAFHAIEGFQPSATYEHTLSLNKSDIVTFAVGYGRNKTHFGDTTGLIITIEKI
jgi:hypothetical protein